jgi:hypothetical protein
MNDKQLETYITYLERCLDNQRLDYELLNKYCQNLETKISLIKLLADKFSEEIKKV